MRRTVGFVLFSAFIAFTIYMATKARVHSWRFAMEVVTKSVEQEELLAHLKQLTSDEFRGRPTANIDEPPSPETILTTEYIADKLRNLPGLQPAGENGSAFQEFKMNLILGKNRQLAWTTETGELISTRPCPPCGKREEDTIYSTASSRNVAFYIPGSKYPDEYVVLMAHHDHLGLGEESRSRHHAGEVHQGANDNASGTSALIKVAEAFSELYQKGVTPKRSVVFLFAGAEESGLMGAVYYANNFPFDGEIITAISTDMVGRGMDSTSLWLVAAPIGVETPWRIPEIWEYSQKYSEIFNFDIEFPPDDENLFYRSDHYAFKDSLTPAMMFTAKFDKAKEQAYLEDYRKVLKKEIKEVAPEKQFHYHTVWDKLYDEDGNLNIDLDRLERYAEFITMVSRAIASGPRPYYSHELKVSD